LPSSPVKICIQNSGSIGDVTIRSIFKPEHEVVARRVLNIATDAVRIYSGRLWPLP